MARKLAYDRLLFAVVLLLTILGLVVVYSATTAIVQRSGAEGNPFFAKQVGAAVVGLFLMVAIMQADYRWLRRPFVLYSCVAGVVVLLVAVLFGPEIQNTRRWFMVGGLSIQPSELAKLALIPYVAYQIEKKRDRLDSAMFLVPVIGLTAILAGLIALGTDMGSAVLLSIPVALMVFIAGLSWRWLSVGGVVMAAFGALGIAVQPYRLARLTSFLHPEDNALEGSYQLTQSLIAVGSGGIFGLGPGNSMQKLHFLPSPHADFVFSIVAEEMGFLGSVLFLALFVVLVWRGVEAGLHAPDGFGRYLAWGFTSIIGIQALLHISVALGLVPTTGIPLPFISHGGSSLVTTLMATGVILNVSEHSS
jgi:cell division protein FtsW